MSEALATVDELQNRMSWTMGEDDKREALGALIDLSDQARFYGSPSWTTIETTPQFVRNLVLRAAARFMRNPDGLVQSRAGDETLVWSDAGERAGAAAFTAEEIASLGRGNGASRLYTASVFAWGERLTPEVFDDAVYVPTTVTPYTFPYYRKDQVVDGPDTRPVVVVGP